MKEALELARKFKKEGKYDLFRGQARDWEIVSSLCRMDNNSKKQHKQRILDFFYFCKNNELLKTYINPNKSNEFIAIAQHYSKYYSEYNNEKNSKFCELNTNFVDFTSCPEIAMYFATNNKENCEIGKECVIICLNKNEFENEVNNGYTQYLCSNQNLPIPRIIEVDLTNLWRLKAQKGCFMELAFVDFDKIYGFDKIVFPYSEPFEDIKKNDIYPERESPLEIELKKFFMDMQIIENTLFIRELMEKYNGISISIDIPPMKKYNEIFQDFSALSQHSSWETIDNKWNDERKISWKCEKDRNQIQVDTQKLLNADLIYCNQLATTIAKNRNMLINIKLTNTEILDSEISEKIKRMYDGMNPWPYTNEHIVNAMKELLKIERYINSMVNKIQIEFGEKKVARDIIQDPLFLKKIINLYSEKIF